MGMYVNINRRYMEQLEAELRPGGEWVFPEELATIVVERVARMEKQPVYGKRAEDIMLNWDHRVLRRMAGEIIAAYRETGVTDYTKFWRAYVLYYMPANFPKVIRAMLELLWAGRLPRHLRLLDMGTGPGTVPLAVIHFYSCLEKYVTGKLRVQIDVVDRWPGHLVLAGKLIEHYKTLLNITFPAKIDKELCGCLEKNRAELAEDLGQTRYNLVSLAHVLNTYELSGECDIKDITDFAMNYLSVDGTLLIIEPATADCARLLAGLHWRYKSGDGLKATAFGPCSYPWGYYPGRRRRCSCWSFVSETWQKPGTIKVLEKYGVPGKKEMKFSYLMLRRDGYNRYQHLRTPERYQKGNFIRLSRLDSYLDKTISILGVVIHVYRNDKHLIMNLCDGTAGLGNCCHVEAGLATAGQGVKLLAGVSHGGLVELKDVVVNRGSRGSKHTLLVTEHTRVTVHRVREKAGMEVV